MCKGRQVKDASIHRGVVNLEVAGVDYGSKWGTDDDPHGVGDAMAHPEPGNFKGISNLMDNTRVYGIHDRIACGTPLFQLGGD